MRPGETDFQRFIGRTSAFVDCADEANKAMIRIWCEMIEDANPLYTNEEYAANTGFGGVVSPPTMLSAWGATAIWPPIEKPPDAKFDQRDLIPQSDLPFIITTDVAEEFFLPVRPGDRLHYNMRLNSISPLKKTRLGEGRFVTTTAWYYNQRNELVGSHQHVVYLYRTPGGSR